MGTVGCCGDIGCCGVWGVVECYGDWVLWDNVGCCGVLYISCHQKVTFMRSLVRQSHCVVAGHRYVVILCCLRRDLTTQAAAIW